MNDKPGMICLKIISLNNTIAIYKLVVIARILRNDNIIKTQEINKNFLFAYCILNRELTIFFLALNYDNHHR